VARFGGEWRCHTGTHTDTSGSRGLGIRPLFSASAGVTTGARNISELVGTHERYSTNEPPKGERRLLLERVPEGADVLDIGCWSGSAGRFLIKHRNATVDGIEPDERMASLARADYRDVFVGPLEQFLIERRCRYDCLLFLDVLEHLVDPSELLRRSKQLVYPGGRALVSIPNVAYWSVRKELLLGRWQYQDNGLLDRTHLRFFTRDSAAELLRDAGWQICWTSASLGQVPLISLPERWLSFFRRWPSLFGVQTLFEVEALEYS
jgi:2-polyprenyl-3-methyl-5-hydroxy-6-metoxy-1,4-benzoquinol methylase